MKKLSLLLLFVAGYFVVSLSSCRKPAEEEDPTTTTTTTTTTTSQTGVIKMTVKTSIADNKPDAEVSITGDLDSMKAGLYSHLQVTNSSGYATFSGLKLNKTYYFHATLNVSGDYYHGDTSAVVKVSNQAANAFIMLKKD